MPNLPFDRSLLGGLASRQAPTDPSPRNPDDIPEISGSPAGFIALIIFLSFIIIFSCVGVFVLLRNPKPDPYERHARRVLSGRREDTLYELPLGPPGLKERVKNLFRFTKKRDGWVRASSGDADEWDASDRLVYRPPNEHRASPDASYKSAEHDFGEAKLHKSDTLESVELEAPSLSIDTEGRGVTLPQLSYSNPYSTSPTAMNPSERTRDGAHPGSSFEGTAAETPMRVFENGTRFKESL